MMMLTFGVNNP